MDPCRLRAQEQKHPSSLHAGALARRHREWAEAPGRRLRKVESLASQGGGESSLSDCTVRALNAEA